MRYHSPFSRAGPLLNLSAGRRALTPAQPRELPAGRHDMVAIDETTSRAYRQAWEDWIKQVEHLHRVFLEGESIRPDQIKGLLNREARAKDRYDTARLALLGLDDSSLAAGQGDDGASSGDGNPFR